MKNIKEFASLVEEKYNSFKEKSLKHRRFKHTDIMPLINELKKNSIFEITELGKSIEEREIFVIKAGTGKTKVLLWSQMHGNEPTGTQALFDLFNFLSLNDEMNEFREKLFSELTLYLIPMVNPDGTQVFKRRNAVDIDPNRDALRLQGVETKLLKEFRDKIEPEFGFNLHDQTTYYTAGDSENPATISFLAPSFNYEQEIDKGRVASMQLIALMNKVLQQRIPDQVGRYNDDFMPTAFGDNMQLWGTNVILIESGGYKNDPEKQYVRQLTFLSILTGLYGIAYSYPANFELMDYFKIPKNKKEKLFDLLIKNVQIEKNNKIAIVDIGIRHKEIDNEIFTEFEYKGEIEDIGDLSYFYGYEEINAKGLFVSAPQCLLGIQIGSTADLGLIDTEGNTAYHIENGFVK